MGRSVRARPPNPLTALVNHDQLHDVAWRTGANHLRAECIEGTKSLQHRGVLADDGHLPSLVRSPALDDAVQATSEGAETC